MPDGLAADPDREAEAFERTIVELGGVDVQIAGLGTNGHLAFNEPGSALDSTTRTVELSPETRHDNARFFADRFIDVPTRAITQGFGTISRARSIVLVVRGSNKARALVGDPQRTGDLSGSGVHTARASGGDRDRRSRRSVAPAITRGGPVNANELLELFPPGTNTDDDGTLVVGGCRLDDLATEFGTPVMVVDEGALRAARPGVPDEFRSRRPAPTWRSRRSPSPAPPFSG